MLLLFFGLIMFIGLVVVHEFGHFIMARRNGVEVEEFGIGFPPAFWKKRIKSDKGDFDFTLNALPLGGFVKLKGENDADTEKGTFGAASLPGKIQIMVAGVVMNLLTAFVLLTFVALVGMPKLVENQFAVPVDTSVVRSDLLIASVPEGSWIEQAEFEQGDVISSVENQQISGARHLEQAVIEADGEPLQIAVERSGETIQKEVTAGAGLQVLRVIDGSPAAAIGLEENDEVISIAGESLYTNDQLRRITSDHAGQEVEVVYAPQGGDITTANAQLRSEDEVQRSLRDGNPIGHFGLATAGLPVVEFEVQRSTWSAPIVAGGLIKQFTELTFKGLGSALASLFKGEGSKASEQVAGPVGIFVILRDGTMLGYQFVLLIIAVISLTLAIMNVLPIPALDGGRLFVTLLFRAIKQPLTKKREDLIHGTGFALLMLLFVVITVVDVRRFF